MIPGSANALLLGSAAGGYTNSRSLRFNSADSAYLSRTPASAGNRKTWTISLWVKRCKLGVLQSFTSSANDTLLLFDGNDKLNFYQGVYVRTTAQVFRDCSAWYHIVLSVDTTNATAQNRARIYVNGNEITTWTTNNTITQNLDTNWNAAFAHQINANNTSQFGDLYIADVHSVDGTAYDASAFGEFSATTGVWMPKAFTGTYGTNGFKLDFVDNSAATAAALGKDTSGNGNNFTPNNLSLAAGAGNDSLVDVPVNGSQTDTGAGGEVRGNYCTLNPLDYGRVASTSVTLSNGNLEASLVRITGTATWVNSTMEIPRSGKWYAEVSNATSTNMLGIASLGINNLSLNNPSKFRSYYGSSGTKISEATETSYGATYTTTDIIGIAVDMDAGTIAFYKNNTSQGTAYSDLLTAGVSWCFFAGTGGGGTNVSTWNFGQRPFAYTAPSGFKALCTANLPAPVITKPSSVFDIVLYSGTSATQIISSLGFSPDLVFGKSRSNTYSPTIQDSVRGAGKTIIYPNQTVNENFFNEDWISSFNSNGFTLPNGYYNESGQSYVAWAWDAGSSTVTNTQGSITSQVRANASAGFSVVTFTYPSSGSFTVGHGLGVAPSLIITKHRNRQSDWYVYHVSATSKNQYLVLNSTAAVGSATDVWGTAAPTSTVFGGTVGTSGISGDTEVAYCFAPVAGYSAFGSYTGNGSADGPFVYLGFRPALVIVKMSSSTGNWTMLDYQREGYNVDNDPLYPNLSNAEGTTDLIDITSNGFKVRTTDATFNTNAGTYVYAAWAQSPFSLARAR